MISKEKAYEIGKKYLEDRKRHYKSLYPVERVFFTKDAEILYGNRKGEKIDTYTVAYSVQWGTDGQNLFIEIDANTGEVLHTIGPYIGTIEDREEDE